MKRFANKKIFLKKVKINFFFRKKDVPLQRIFGYPFITHGEDTYRTDLGTARLSEEYLSEEESGGLCRSALSLVVQLGCDLL